MTSFLAKIRRGSAATLAAVVMVHGALEFDVLAGVSSLVLSKARAAEASIHELIRPWFGLPVSGERRTVASRSESDLSCGTLQNQGETSTTPLCCLPQQTSPVELQTRFEASSCCISGASHLQSTSCRCSSKPGGCSMGRFCRCSGSSSGPALTGMFFQMPGCSSGPSPLAQAGLSAEPLCLRFVFLPVSEKASLQREFVVKSVFPDASPALAAGHSSPPESPPRSV